MISTRGVGKRIPLLIILSLLLPQLSFAFILPEFISEPLDVIVNKSSSANTYEKICKIKIDDKMDLNKKWKPICNIVKNSELCKEVKAEEKLRCTTYDENKVDIISFSFLSNCASGIGKSIKEFFAFIKEGLKWLYQTSTDSKKRSEVSQKVSETYDMAMNYLAIEMDKQQDEGHNIIVAGTIVAGRLLTEVFSLLGEIIKDSFYHLGCLNSDAREKHVCKIVSDIVFPPVFVFSVLKGGVVFLKNSSKFTKYFKKNKLKRMRKKAANMSKLTLLSKDFPKSERELTKLLKSIKHDHPQFNDEEILARVREMLKGCKK